MKKKTRTITILWKAAACLFLIVLIGYLTIGFLLPAPEEPEPISLNGSIFESIFEPFDGQFVSVYAGAGKSGMGWSYSITMNKGSVELFIDRGPDKKEETNEIYEIIFKDREKIENAFGEALEWDKKEGRRVCRIKSHCFIGGLNDTDSWAEIQDDMIDKMKRLEEALRPSLGKI